MPNYYFERCEENCPGVTGIMVAIGDQQMRLSAYWANTIRSIHWVRDANGKMIKATGFLDEDTRKYLSNYGFKLKEVEGGKWESEIPVSILWHYRQVAGTLIRGRAE